MGITQSYTGHEWTQSVTVLHDWETVYAKWSDEVIKQLRKAGQTENGR